MLLCDWRVLSGGWGGLVVMMWCKDGRGGVEDCGRLSVLLWPIVTKYGVCDKG